MAITTLDVKDSGTDHKCKTKNDQVRRTVKDEEVFHNTYGDDDDGGRKNFML